MKSKSKRTVVYLWLHIFSMFLSLLHWFQKYMSELKRATVSERNERRHITICRRNYIYWFSGLFMCSWLEHKGSRFGFSRPNRTINIHHPHHTYRKPTHIIHVDFKSKCLWLVLITKSIKWIIQMCKLCCIST